MAYQSAEYHPAFEQYTETIWELSEDGTEVIQARIAERLDVSRPAVSEMVRRMEREGLVDVDDSGLITLTAEGRSLGTTVVRRHRLAERFLTDVLQLDWIEAHHEAGKWEHVISPTVEAAMMRVLADPTTCPHGNPIPGSAYEAPEGMMSLADVPPSGEFVVERIPEEMEFEEGQLEYLEAAGLVPGGAGRVLGFAPDGTATLEMGERPVGISGSAASRIMVISR
jgi:DtxR family Mn-dependent transcriptional regulator